MATQCPADYATAMYIYQITPPFFLFSFYNRKFNIKAKVDGAATLSPDGASLYFGAQNGALYKLDAVNGNKVR